MDRLERWLYAVVRLSVAIFFVAGAAWGLIVTAASLLGVPQSRVMAVVAVVGLIVGVAVLESTGKKPRPTPPAAPSETVPTAPGQSSLGKWRELREVERCRAEGLISEQQAQIERQRILGPETPKQR
jgi:hypothetical protein